MIRRQQIGRRYLAAVVMGFAAVYLAATCATSAFAWRDTYPLWLVTNWLALGLVPSLAAFALGLRAWSAKPTPSAALSAVALILLLVAMIVWQLFVVSF
jgi:drug/metabolite transporter (DMT)-like permease